VVLPLIPVIGLGFLVTFVVLYGMTHGLQTWLASLLNSLAHPQGSFWKVGALKVAGAIVGAAAYVFRAVGHACSQVAAHSIPRVAHWLDGVAAWVTHNATIAGSFADEVATGFERLVAHTIPAELGKWDKGLPKKIAISLGLGAFGAAELALLGKGIDTLLRGIGSLSKDHLRRVGHGIDRLVREHVIERFNTVERVVTHAIPKELGKVRSRVGRAERTISNPSARWVKAIWKRGWILVGAGLMLRFLVKKFPHLFCRNVTKTAKAICNPANNLLVDLLLGEAIAAFAIADICQVVKGIEVLAEGFEPILRELVTAEDDFFDWCGNDLPTAHDTPGYDGPWLATAL
jgi:hypothetical protein